MPEPVVYLLSFRCKNREKVKKLPNQELGRASCTSLWCTSIQDTWDFTKSRNETAEVEIEELVVHLERNMDLSTMEQGVKLVGKVLANKTL